MVRFCFEIQQIVFLQLVIKSFDYLTKIVFLPLSPSVHQRDKALLAAMMNDRNVWRRTVDSRLRSRR